MSITHKAKTTMGTGRIMELQTNQPNSVMEMKVIIKVSVAHDRLKNDVHAGLGFKVSSMKACFIITLSPWNEYFRSPQLNDCIMSWAYCWYLWLMFGIFCSPPTKYCPHIPISMIYSSWSCFARVIPITNGSIFRIVLQTGLAWYNCVAYVIRQDSNSRFTLLNELAFQ